MEIDVFRQAISIGFFNCEFKFIHRRSNFGCFCKFCSLSTLLGQFDACPGVIHVSKGWKIEMTRGKSFEKNNISSTLHGPFFSGGKRFWRFWMILLGHPKVLIFHNGFFCNVNPGLNLLKSPFVRIECFIIVTSLKSIVNLL